MDDKQIEEFIKRNNKKPKLILVYVQSAKEVAWYAIHNGIKITPPGAVMTSVGTLDDDTYKILKKPLDVIFSIDMEPVNVVIWLVAVKKMRVFISI